MASIADRAIHRRVRDSIVERVKQRVAARRGRFSLPFELEYRHVFVLPTAFGWGFGLMLVFMALGGLNFNNNMALMLVFLLATIAQLTTLVAYRNLSGLKIESIQCDPVFCGDSARFRVFLSNAGERQRLAVLAGFGKLQDCRDFKPDSCEALELGLPSSRRGWLAMPAFRLETRFPLGLFKAWSWIFPQARCLVYPSPASNPPPLPDTGHGQSGQPARGEGDQIHGLRRYQPGDSRQRVAWRASARHDKLYSLEMESPRDAACELHWRQLPGRDPETRLRILTAWVLSADHRQLSYSLELPSAKIAAGQGPVHRSRCLELLALHR